MRLAVLCCVLSLLPATVRAEEAPSPARPWLGVLIEKGTRGVRVVQVMPESPCESADVHPGDEVLSFSGAVLTQPSDLTGAVQRQAVGAQVTLQLVSPQGRERTVRLPLGPRPNIEGLQRRTLLGKQAPDFAPRVLSGRPMASLSGLHGQVVLLDFFASWCGPCMRALPELSAIHRRYAGRGLRVVGVSSETAQTISQVVTEHGLPYTVAMDTGELGSRAYYIHLLPTLVVVDRKGVVRSVSPGDLAETVQQIEEALDPKGRR